MLTKRVCFAFFFIFLCHAAIGGSLQPDVRGAATLSARGASDILPEVASRLSRLDGLHIVYRKVVEYTPFDRAKIAATIRMIERKTGGKAGPVRNSRVRYACTFICSYDCVWYDYLMRPGSVAALASPKGSGYGIIHGIRSYMPDRCELLNYEFRQSSPLGIISASEPIPNSTLAMAIGLKGWGSERLIELSKVKKMHLISLAGGAFTLSSTSGGGYDSRWTFHSVPRLEITEFTALKGGVAFVRIHCGHFRKVNGIWLPGRIVETDLPLGGGGRSSRNVRLSHIKYAVIKHPMVEKDFMIVWPKGAVVLDQRTGHTFRIVSRPMRLTDKEIFNLMKKWDNGMRQKDEPSQ